MLKLINIKERLLKDKTYTRKTQMLLERDWHNMYRKISKVKIKSQTNSSKNSKIHHIYCLMIDLKVISSSSILKIKNKWKSLRKKSFNTVQIVWRGSMIMIWIFEYKIRSINILFLVMILVTFRYDLYLGTIKLTVDPK